MPLSHRLENMELEVGGRIGNVHIVGAKQRIELLPVASQEIDCTPKES